MAMSENNDAEEIVRKGNEWEVVALTESAYAAAPGPKQDSVDISHNNLSGDVNAETVGVMFMSGHFGSPPSMHENVPLEPECNEKHCEMGSDHDVPEATVQQGNKSGLKHEENLHTEGLISNEFPGVPQFDEKGMPYMADVSSGTAEPFESLDDAANPGMSNVQKHIEGDKFNDMPSIPCEARWRKHAACLYGRAKNANPYWCIVVAATVMGLMIIGHRWQRDKPQVF